MSLHQIFDWLWNADLTPVFFIIGVALVVGVVIVIGRAARALVEAWWRKRFRTELPWEKVRWAVLWLFIALMVWALVEAWMEGKGL